MKISLCHYLIFKINNGERKMSLEPLVKRMNESETAVLSKSKCDHLETVNSAEKTSQIFIDIKSLLVDKFFICTKLLSSEALNRLLNGTVEWKIPLSKNRTIDKIWKGCFNLNDDDIKYFGKVKLPDGRIDVNLPRELAKKIVSIDEEKLLKFFPEGFRVASYQLLVNPTNPKTQDWHQDNGAIDPDDYYTLLMPLVDAKGMGKTEVRIPYTKKFSKKAKEITPDVKVGDGLLFSGSLWHRGTPNHSKLTRYCIYVIITRAPKEKLFEEWK